MPQSLQIIFDELERSGLGKRTNVTLSDWAEQGVMLLNIMPTTEENHSTSPHHDKGWEYFIGQTLRCINLLPQRFVVMAWGAPIQEMVRKYIKQTSAHLVLSSCHPMAQVLSKGKIPFVGCDHFVKANEHLGERAITWVPPVSNKIVSSSTNQLH
jgi:uracil-DNA glycosylase